MKKLPLGKSDFKDIIQNNFVYVDKTKYIYNLIESGDVYFLSRPRRFGKSLTVSTLYYLFKGEKELFKDTWIYDKWHWEEWPVIKLDMSRLNGKTVTTNQFRLIMMLKEIAKEYGIELEYLEPELYDMTIDELIRKLAKKYGKDVVVLVDEYDYPMLSNITDDGELERQREFLSGFYIMLKANSEYIRFVFITGISKFSKVSIFSKMNNLIDLTLNEEFSAMLGYVDDEIDRYYREHIEVVKERLNLSETEFWEKIREWYNGYSWDAKTKLYNPDSISRFFFEKDFQNYWFSTGTPTFLVNYIKSKGVSQLSENKINKLLFGSYEIENAPLPSFLFQTGYYTIVKKDETYYYFDYPNREVKESFSLLLIYEMGEKEVINEVIDKMKEDYKNNCWDGLIEDINKIVSRIPYTMIQEFGTEAQWQTLMYMILSAVFGNVNAEEMSYKGRSDLVVRYADKVVVIEMKLDRSAKEAIEQIKKKGYADKYKAKEVWMMGINIDSKERRINEFVVEKRR